MGRETCPILSRLGAAAVVLVCQVHTVALLWQFITRFFCATKESELPARVSRERGLKKLSKIG